MEGDDWVAEDPNGPPLFYPVANPEEFEQTLADITTGLDCVAS
jgi:hypothetical protein